MKHIIRKDNESPFVIKKLNWKYHHIGIPGKESLPGEKYFTPFEIICFWF